MKSTVSSLWQRVWRTARPWLVTLVLVIALRYTGALSAFQYATGSLVVKTGLLNASTEAPAVLHPFSYDFKLVDLDGTPVNVQNLRGKTLFINIWATWCGPCRVEMPTIEALYQRCDTSKVAFLMISVDDVANYDKVRTFVTDKGFSFPVFTPGSALPALLQPRSIPTTFVVAPNGTVVMRESGLANYDTDRLEAFLEAQ